MVNLVNLLIGFVALQHIIFLILEMFCWTKPLGLKIFKMNREQAEATSVLAKNQGLYNGFLAAGLIWSLTVPGLSLKIFFLTCVIVAGIFGGLTADLGIVLIQALPAALALAWVWFGR